MKRLVLLGEGYGEVAALPVLVKRLLCEKDAANLLYVDREVIRTKPSEMVRWNKPRQQPDHDKWISRLTLATRRRDVGGVLAVLTGTSKCFPLGLRRTFAPPPQQSPWPLQPAQLAQAKYFHSASCLLVQNMRRGLSQVQSLWPAAN